MSLHFLKDAQRRKQQGDAQRVKQVKVGFNKWQYNTVHSFLEELKTSGAVEAELGAPINVSIDWSTENDLKAAHIELQGKHAYKVIKIQDVLEAAAPKDETAND